MLHDLFAQFDPRGNGRFTFSDLVRICEEFGMPFSMDDMRAMIRLADSSGTASVSRDDFTQIAVTSKFVHASSTR